MFGRVAEPPTDPIDRGLLYGLLEGGGADGAIPGPQGDLIAWGALDGIDPWWLREALADWTETVTGRAPTFAAMDRWIRRLQAAGLGGVIARRTVQTATLEWVPREQWPARVRELVSRLS